MKLDKKLKIEKCASDDTTRSAICDPYLDLSDPKSPLLVATDGHGLVALHAVIAEGDKAGSVPVAAIIAARKAGGWIDLSSERAAVVAGVSYPRQFNAITGGPCDFPEWRRILPETTGPRLTIGLNPRLLSEIAQAMNAETVNLTFDPNRPLDPFVIGGVRAAWPCEEAAHALLMPAELEEPAADAPRWSLGPQDAAHAEAVADLTAARAELDAAKVSLAHAEAQAAGDKAELANVITKYHARERELATKPAPIVALAPKAAPASGSVEDLQAQIDALQKDLDKALDERSAMEDSRDDWRLVACDVAGLSTKAATPADAEKALEGCRDLAPIAEALDMKGETDSDDLAAEIRSLKSDDAVNDATAATLVALALSAPEIGGRCRGCGGPLTSDGHGHRPSCGFSIETLSTLACAEGSL
jgi:hypothetical protein